MCGLLARAAARRHLEKAEKLIQHTGYHRHGRDANLVYYRHEGSGM